MKLVDLLIGSEAKVCNLKAEILINEDVLKLQVSVDDSLVLDVPKDIEHLRQKVPSSFFTHASNSLAQIEEEPTSDVLEQNVDKVLDFSS